MMNLYQDQFSKDRDFLENNEVEKILIIATTGRSGSHMLGHALYETRCFGFPLEYANPSNVVEWTKQLDVDDMEELISRLKKKRTSPNGVFSIKLHYSHVKALGGFQEMQKLFPNAYFVHLTRRDLLKQAISTVIAEQTGVWILGQVKKKNAIAHYNYHSIDRVMRQVVLDNASWRYFFETGGSRYIELEFDEVKKNLKFSIEKIANFMGVHVEASSIPEAQITKSQSTKINEEWRQKFIKECEENELLALKGVWAICKNYLKRKINDWYV